MHRRSKYLLVWLLSWLFTLNTSAQNTASVKSFVQTMDHIPVNDRRNDLNGTPCALIKVQVVDDIERVEGNKIGDIITKGVEKWVYMCKGSRNIRIHLKNHLPVRVMFQDYEINGLESNRVYELVINVPQEGGTVASSAVKSGEFRLNVNPASAVVSVWSDGSPRKTYRPQENGQLTIKLPYGRYFFEVSANTYYKQEGNVFISDNPVSESFTLQHTQEWVEEQQRLEQQRLEEQRRQEEQRIAEERRKEEQRLAEEKRREEQRLAEQQRLEEQRLAEQRRIEEERRQEEARLAAEREAERARIKKEKHDSRMAKLEQLEQKSFAFGLKAGYNMATAQFSSDYKGTTGSVGGFHIGVTADMRLSDAFHFCSGLIYSAKGYTYKNGNSDVDEDGKGQYIDIPLQASFRLPLGSSLKLTVNVGPYVAICAGGKVKDNVNKPLYEESFGTVYSGFDYGLQAGVSLIISYHISLGLDYQMGMATKYPNRNLMVGVGYRF